ncbi:hypothetical protein CPLU01_09199 [Colletotrichum plurivorum]|uniref:Uncharacterized protein n=1 Tax=Colletotrichum plurivorum TaxID=2175906 RepID=A0A8H6NC63_9PEZI|nr:hypothetical protein CPLU01_09199 [Colletotrichum plurivorum]
MTTTTTTTKTLASPPGPAALQVLGTPELLGLIAENVIVDAQLASLCLVDRTFNNIFTRHLYCDVHIRGGSLLGGPKVREAIRRFLDLPKLCYARSLRLSFLPSMDRPSPEEWPVNSKMLRRLHASCPRLKAVSFDLENKSSLRFCRDDHSAPDSDSDSEEAFVTEDVSDGLTYGIADFLVFTGLASLKLYRIQGDLDLWLRTIAQMLGNSPVLCELALSISEKLVEQLEEQEELQSLSNVFVNLAKQYAKLGHEPLRLRTLEL